jgi:mannose-1-phosphate guanylyltransferase
VKVLGMDGSLAVVVARLGLLTMCRMPARQRPEAVIVAGGFGTRMLPLTERRPKHLLEVGGVPFLAHQLTKLAASGVEHVVLATSYRAELFAPVLGDGSRYGVRLSYVQEQEPLGTGGAIRNVADALDPDPGHPVVVLNGDVLSGHDLRRQLVEFVRPRDGRSVDVSLHLVEVPDARAFGCVPTDEQGRVLAFVEKSDDPVTNQVNAGCYVFRREVIDAIPAGRVVSVERETFPGLVEVGALVVGYVESAYWRDVGSPEALVAASRDVVLGLAPTEAVAPSEGTSVAGDAVVKGTVTGGSVVLPGAEIAESASVIGSVVMSGARVDRDARVVDSVIGPGAVVGAGACLDGVSLGDEARVTAGATLTGCRVGCGETAGREVGAQAAPGSGASE